MTGSLLTAAEVAKLLGVPKSWVYEQSRRGWISTVRVETRANTWIVMRQVASAGQIADAFGPRTTKKETIQRDRNRLVFTDTRMRPVRQVEEDRISPNVLRGVGRGVAIIWRRLRSGALERMWIDPVDRPGRW